MARRYKRKNEFRMDLNKKHYGDKKKPHPAYITAEYGNLYKANNITHSEYLKNGRKTKKLYENPNKRNNQENYKRYSRISPPYWQDKSKFSQTKLKKYRFSRKTRKQIKKYNKNFMQ